MCLKLLFLFIVVPFVEVVILIKLGREIGFWPTVAIQVATGFAGASLARLQGLQVWQKIQKSLAEGMMPAEELVDGLLILAAGLVLLTPGLLTDALGILLLIPWTRAWFKRYLRKKFEKMAQDGSTSFTIHMR